MTADANQMRPSIPEGEQHDEEVRAALAGAGVDMTGLSRDGGGNSRVSRPFLSSSGLAEAVAATGITGPPPSADTSRLATKGADATVAQRFAEWQKKRAAIDEDRAMIKKAQDAVEALQGGLDRERAKAEKKRRRADAIAKSPVLRESHAHGKGLRAAKKHLVAGVDQSSALALGWGKYREHGGKLALAPWKRSLLGEAADK